MEFTWERLGWELWWLLTAGCLPLGLRSAELTAFWHCLPFHKCYGKVSLKVIGGFFKQNVWAAEAASSVTVTVSLARTKSEARVWKEDVCVALVKLTLETLFLVLSEIVSSCFPFNCLLCALHVLFLCFCLYLPFTSVSCPPHLSRPGGRRKLPLEGDRHLPPAGRCPGTPTPRPGDERPLLAVIY